MKNFLLNVASDSNVYCHVALDKDSIGKLLELRQKFLDTQKTTPGLAYFEVSDVDAEFYTGDADAKITARLTDDETAAMVNRPWLELPIERANEIVHNIEVARTTCDYMHIDECGVFWSCSEKYSEEIWETGMIPWEEFGVKPVRDRAALALAIVEQLAEEFAEAERKCMEEGGEGINGGDLVDWITHRLNEDGFLDEAEKKLEDERDADESAIEASKGSGT